MIPTLEHKSPPVVLKNSDPKNDARIDDIRDERFALISPHEFISLQSKKVEEKIPSEKEEIKAFIRTLEDYQDSSEFLIAVAVSLERLAIDGEDEILCVTHQLEKIIKKSPVKYIHRVLEILKICNRKKLLAPGICSEYLLSFLSAGEGSWNKVAPMIEPIIAFLWETTPGKLSYSSDFISFIKKLLTYEIAEKKNLAAASYVVCFLENEGLISPTSWKDIPIYTAFLTLDARMIEENLRDALFLVNRLLLVSFQEEKERVFDLARLCIREIRHMQEGCDLIFDRRLLKEDLWEEFDNDVTINPHFAIPIYEFMENLGKNKNVGLFNDLLDLKEHIEDDIKTINLLESFAECQRIPFLDHKFSGKSLKKIGRFWDVYKNHLQSQTLTIQIITWMLSRVNGFDFLMSIKKISFFKKAVKENAFFFETILKAALTFDEDKIFPFFNQPELLKKSQGCLPLFMEAINKIPVETLLAHYDCYLDDETLLACVADRFFENIATIDLAGYCEFLCDSGFLEGTLPKIPPSYRLDVLINSFARAKSPYLLEQALQECIESPSLENGIRQTALFFTEQGLKLRETIPLSLKLSALLKDEKTVTRMITKWNHVKETPILFEILEQIINNPPPCDLRPLILKLSYEDKKDLVPSTLKLIAITKIEQRMLSQIAEKLFTIASKLEREEILLIPNLEPNLLHLLKMQIEETTVEECLFKKLALQPTVEDVKILLAKIPLESEAMREFLINKLSTLKLEGEIALLLIERAFSLKKMYPALYQLCLEFLESGVDYDLKDWIKKVSHLIQRSSCPVTDLIALKLILRLYEHPNLPKCTLIKELSNLLKKGNKTHESGFHEILRAFKGKADILPALNTLESVPLILELMPHNSIVLRRAIEKSSTYEEMEAIALILDSQDLKEALLERALSKKHFNQKFVIAHLHFVDPERKFTERLIATLCEWAEGSGPLSLFYDTKFVQNVIAKKMSLSELVLNYAVRNLSKSLYARDWISICLLGANVDILKQMGDKSFDAVNSLKSLYLLADEEQKTGITKCMLYLIKRSYNKMTTEEFYSGIHKALFNFDPKEWSLLHLIYSELRKFIPDRAEFKGVPKERAKIAEVLIFLGKPHPWESVNCTIPAIQKVITYCASFRNTLFLTRAMVTFAWTYPIYMRARSVRGQEHIPLIRMLCKQIEERQGVQPCQIIEFSTYMQEIWQRTESDTIVKDFLVFNELVAGSMNVCEIVSEDDMETVHAIFKATLDLIEEVCRRGILKECGEGFSLLTNKFINCCFKMYKIENDNAFIEYELRFMRTIYTYHEELGRSDAFSAFIILFLRLAKNEHFKKSVQSETLGLIKSRQTLGNSHRDLIEFSREILQYCFSGITEKNKALTIEYIVNFSEATKKFYTGQQTSWIEEVAKMLYALVERDPRFDEFFQDTMEALDERGV